MLHSLNVENIALIKQAEITFTSGLNVISGETGAGKSILIGSINTAMGGKTNKDMIRRETDHAYAELLFYPGEEKLQKIAEDFELELSVEDPLIVSRRLTGGKSLAKINGESVPVAKTAALSSYLLDLHSQKEHLSLLKLSKHLEMTDIFAGKEALQLKQQIAGDYRRFVSLKSQREEFCKDQKERARELSYLEFALNEIAEANLIVGEEEELADQFKRIVNQKDIAEGLQEVLEYTGDDRGAMGDQVAKCIHAISRLLPFDDHLQPIHDTLYDLESLLTDLNHQVRDYTEDAMYDEEQLAEIEKRLDRIRELEAKYGSTIPEVLDFYSENEARLQKLQHYDEILQDMDLELSSLHESLMKNCMTLSELRKKAGKVMEQQIVEALKDLNFLDVRFEIQFRPLDSFAATGMDEAEFMISTNPGEPIKPLRQIASGGEMSRIMLALKSVLADSDDVETLIFDEIDTGISGRTAQKVAEKLHQIARKHQVICISHLPQIVSMADTHFVIEKYTDGEETITSVNKLNEEESVVELARLLGGTEITEMTLASAKEMKKMALKNS